MIARVAVVRVCVCGSLAAIALSCQLGRKQGDAPAVDKSMASGALVTCPAVEREDRRFCDPLQFANFTRFELVVRGTRLGDEASGNVLRVDEVLYGSCSEATIEARGMRQSDSRPRLVALRPSVYDDEPPWTVAYDVSATPLAVEATRLLCAARLDYTALSADTILVAREVPRDPPPMADDYCRSLEVLRCLGGAHKESGEVLLVDWYAHLRVQGKTPRVDSTPRVYFLEDVPRTPHVPSPSLRVMTRLPADRQAHVLAARARHAHYPTTTIARDGKTVEVREIVPPMDARTALRLLGSESDAGVLLGSRALLTNPAESLSVLTDSIRTNMITPGNAGAVACRRQRSAIETLGELEAAHPTGALHTLVDALLEHIAMASRGAADSTTAQSPRGNLGLSVDDPGDHSLSWLLMQLAPPDAATRHGARLLSLGTQGVRSWRREVLLALSETGIQDRLELADILLRSRDADPLRYVPPLRHPDAMAVCGASFSRDGSALATASYGMIRVWHTADWTLAGEVVVDGPCDAVALSPCARYVYVTTPDKNLPVARYALHGGRRDRVYSSQREVAIHTLSLDTSGRQLMGIDGGGSAHFWDTENRHPPQYVAAEESAASVWADPDAGCWVRATAEGGEIINRESEGVILRIREKDAGPVQAVGFAGAGQVVLAQARPLPQRGSVLTAVSLDGRAHTLARVLVPNHDVRSICVSARHETVVSVDRTGRVLVFRFPSLRGPTAVLPARGRVASISTCDSLGLMAIADSQDAPRFVSVVSGEEVVPYPGHGAVVAHAAFVEGGRSLRTVGLDNTVCDWGVDGMEMTSRVFVPAELRIASAHPGDCRYLFCFLASRTEDAATSLARMETAHIVDAKTGDVILEQEVPFAGRNGTKVWWFGSDQVAITTPTEGRVIRIPNGQALEVSLHEVPNDTGTMAISPESAEAYVIAGGGAFPPYEATLRVYEWPRMSLRDSGGVPDAPRRFGRFGLVPNTQLFFLADPGLWIFDRRSQRLVSHAKATTARCTDVSFSLDGSRCAWVSEAPVEQGPRARREAPRFVRVVRTKTCEPIYAFEATSHIRRVVLSEDAQRLLIVYAGGGMEVRRLGEE